MRSCTSRSVHKAQEYSQGIIQGLLLTHASPVQRTSMLVDGGQPMNGATYLRFVSTSLSLSSAVWASAASAPKLASPFKPERAEAGLKQQQTAQHDLVSCASWCYWAPQAYITSNHQVTPAPWPELALEFCARCCSRWHACLQLRHPPRAAFTGPISCGELKPLHAQLCCLLAGLRSLADGCHCISPLPLLLA